MKKCYSRAKTMPCALISKFSSFKQHCLGGEGGGQQWGFANEKKTLKTYFCYVNSWFCMISKQYTPF